MKWILLSFIGGVFLLIPLVAALQISYQKSCSQSDLVQINVLNDQNSSDKYGLVVLGPYRVWAIGGKPIKLNPQERGIVQFKILPPAKARNGRYRFPFSVYSFLEPRKIHKTGEVCFFLKKPLDMKLLAKLGEKSLEPGKLVAISALIINRGANDQEGELKVILKALGKDASTLIRIPANENLSESLFLKLPPRAKPGSYEIDVKLAIKGEVFEDHLRLKIKSVKKFERSVESRGNFLASSRTIKIKNSGNVPLKKEVKIELPFPHSLLASATNAKLSGSILKRTISWKVMLKPGQSKKLSYQVGWWLLWLLIASAVCTYFGVRLGIWHYSLPLLEKSWRKTGDGLKICLEVNSRGKKVQNLRVQDRIPRIAQVQHKFDTLEPILEGADGGTKVKFELGELGPREHRILTYGLKPLIGTDDYFLLPQAKLQAVMDGKDIKRSSSKIKLRPG